ncbi:MAG: hypothetical protein FWE23_11280 [Chitinivibrionia bacterium]|nr:hypothetical protein [Chitinivibrionia bacterium]
MKKRIMFLLVIFFCILSIISCDFIVKNVDIDKVENNGKENGNLSN